MTTTEKKVKENSFDNIRMITISIGITQQKEDDTYKTLFDRADRALYNAKDAGRDNTKFI